VDFLGTPLVLASLPGQLTRDAGLLSICRFEEQIGLTWA
jgi:hypothetical protein